MKKEFKQFDILRCEVYNISDLSTLFKVRNDWNNKNFNDARYYNRNEIINHINNGSFVYVLGIGEVDKTDINKIDQYIHDRLIKKHKLNNIFKIK